MANCELWVEIPINIKYWFDGRDIEDIEIRFNWQTIPASLEAFIKEQYEKEIEDACLENEAEANNGHSLQS
jgi:hypothetical protein